MNPEPLTKEKIRYHNYPEYGGNPESCFKVEDVKSAVNWLLKEIEKEKKVLETKLKEVRQLGYPRKEDGRTIQRCMLVGSVKELQAIEEKIKKAFEGVMDD